MQCKCSLYSICCFCFLLFYTSSFKTHPQTTSPTRITFTCALPRLWPPDGTLRLHLGPKIYKRKCERDFWDSGAYCVPPFIASAAAHINAVRVYFGSDELSPRCHASRTRHRAVVLAFLLSAVAVVFSRLMWVLSLSQAHEVCSTHSRLDVYWSLPDWLPNGC